ncbi:MAG: 60S ribosomal export protein NMD3 [Candidatus Freyarchaeota archaeon]
MAKRFCALCGRTDTLLVENLCVSCYFKKHPPFSVKQESTVWFCPQCFSYKLTKRWVQTNCTNETDFLEQLLKNVLPRFIKHAPGIELIIEPQITEVELKHKIEVPVSITIKKENLTLNERVTVTITLEPSLCGLCTRKRRGDYESILQFRSLRGRVSEEERQQIYDIIERVLQAEKHKDDYIPQIKEKKQGFDVYVSTTKLAKNIAASVKELMGANLQESFKLSGMKNGKKQGKISISVRLPSLSVGEIVQVSDRTVLFEKIEKGNLVGRNLETGERTVIQHKELWESEIQSWKPSTEEYLIISIAGDFLQMMNLENYEILEIRKEPSHFNLREGDTVKAINMNGKIIILTPEGASLFPTRGD